MSNISPLLGAAKRRGGGVAEVSTFTFIGDPELWVGGGPGFVSLYFTIGLPTGQAYIYFGRDGANDPAPSGFVRGILVDPGDTSYGIFNRVIYAQAMATVLNADGDFTAIVTTPVDSGIPQTVEITATTTGPRADITLGDIPALDASAAVITPGS